MPVYLQVDLLPAVSLATNSGWGDVGEYADAQSIATLQHLCEYGWSGKVDQLAADLAAAKPPRRDDVRETVENLRKTLAGAKDAQVVSVTDGLGPDEEE